MPVITFPKGPNTQEETEEETETQEGAIEQKRLQLEGKNYKTQLETKERVTKKQTKKRGIL